MAVIGAHMLPYTSEPEAPRAMLRDVFGFRHVDAGDGWSIFALRPSELGVHPAEGPHYDAGARHQLSFMCDDIRATAAELRAKGVTVEGDPSDEGGHHRDACAPRWLSCDAVRAAPPGGDRPVN